MKSLEQIKTEYTALLLKPKNGLSENALKKRQKEAGRLRLMIQQMEAGVDEASILRQLIEVENWFKILDSRYNIKTDGKKEIYEKKWGYPDKKRQMKWMMWMLKR